jgi:hypothetical protein
MIFELHKIEISTPSGAGAPASGAPVISPRRRWKDKYPELKSRHAGSVRPQAPASLLFSPISVIRRGVSDWLLAPLPFVDGGAWLKHLTRLTPASLRYWTARRMVNAEYLDGAAIFDELVAATFLSLPPPADGQGRNYYASTSHFSGLS